MRRFVRIIVGFLATLGLLVVVGLGLSIWAASALHDRAQPPLPRRMVLELDLENEFREAESSDPFTRLSGEKSYVLRRVVAALDRAAADEHVVGLFATLGHAQLGMAGAQELRDAVARFRASDKPTVVFAETMGEFGNGTVETYIASAFGEVWLQPSGDVGLTGFMVESPFLKGTLEMLGIDTQFAARKEYKTAIETFTEKAYSPAHAETLAGLLDSWTRQAVDGIAQGRRLPAEKVRALFGNGPFLAAEALSAGLVDKLGYRDQAWAAAAGAGPKPETVDIADYADHAPKGKGTRIALIVGEGAIMRGEAEGPLGKPEGFGSELIGQAFRDAIDDPEVKAILFRIDSPGGSYVASDTIWNEVRRARAAGKPVVASMGAAAASGGYFVAMAADRIVAQPGTITGSIGVFTGKVVLAEFWQKLGITWDEMHRGDNATMWSMNRPFPPQAWDRVNAMLDRIYADFTGKAAEGRRMAPEKLEQVARGRVWSGAEAKAVGLVDTLGGYPEAEAELRALLKLAPDAALDLVAFPAPKSPLEMVAKVLGGGGSMAEDENLRTLLGAARVLAPLAERLQALDPAGQALRAPGLPPVRP
ncbi:signal peptide peptidase SppA [Magnetospirillum sp. UT-4]|uniref:signal peptide peptidase SppA n=1 Tax=Magnetospirillum sp. UT-4 TaxID=2681467 RepID=UPI00138023A3|nr:signal peptide peptidase SppA [Magnetospirillum sp. UT-4]CAA7620524.1 Protease(Signal peptide peptidase) [Magnetospirillum sp. UT-4]